MRESSYAELALAARVKQGDIYVHLTHTLYSRHMAAQQIFQIHGY
jgi:hypothetical protein